jgi:preprotein translocase subunit SecA
MRLFGGENIKNLMAKIGMEAGEPIYHPWLNKSIERAQKKVEERNFEIRKHLLEYDDVLNQQRKFIYEQRDIILSDSNLKPRIHDATFDMVENAIANYQQAQKHSQAEALLELSNYLKTQFGYILHIEDEGKDAQLPEKLSARIIADLERDIEEKESLVGEANLNHFIRMQYLQSIDRKWLDHLENMEGLRESVYLRSYAQKNPLTEYKLEGAQIFDTMIDTIRAEIASRLHLVRIQTAGDREVRSRATVTQSATHGSMGAFAGSVSAGNVSPGGGRGGAGAGQEAVTVVRAVPKVGRNDPCPCGSGKKYKFCHGR